MDNASPLPDRGKTWFDGTTPPTSFAQTVDLEGKSATFPDKDPTAANKGQLRSGRNVKCRFVRNVSGITLATKRLVKWASGYVGRRVDGYASTTYGNDAAGVVDDHYATGIPANDLGWIVVKGPCLCYTGYSTVAQAEMQACVVDAGSTSQAASAGKMLGIAVTTNVTYGHSGAMNTVARALTARTSANTNTATLYDILLDKAGD